MFSLSFQYTSVPNMVASRWRAGVPEGQANKAKRTSCPRTTDACVKMSALVTQRPTVGGEDSIDKNKQSMTIPPRIAATHIKRPPPAINDCNLPAEGNALTLENT